MKASDLELALLKPGRASSQSTQMVSMASSSCFSCCASYSFDLVCKLAAAQASSTTKFAAQQSCMFSHITRFVQKCSQSMAFLDSIRA